MDELRALGVQVAEAELGETVGALVVELLGRLPRAGDKVDFGHGATAEVTGVSRRRVTRVRLTRQEAGSGGAGALTTKSAMRRSFALGAAWSSSLVTVVSAWLTFDAAAPLERPLDALPRVGRRRRRSCAGTRAFGGRDPALVLVRGDAADDVDARRRRDRRVAAARRRRSSASSSGSRRSRRCPIRRSRGRTPGPRRARGSPSA